MAVPVVTALSTLVEIVVATGALVVATIALVEGLDALIAMIRSLGRKK